MSLKRQAPSSKRWCFSCSLKLIALSLSILLKNEKNQFWYGVKTGEALGLIPGPRAVSAAYDNTATSYVGVGAENINPANWPG